MDLSLFEQLMANRQITFKDGDIEMMGNRMVMPNAMMLAEIILRFSDSEEAVYNIYEATKKSFAEGTASTVGKHYEFSFYDYFDWLTKIAMIVGWGKFKWEGLEEQNKKGLILVENSAIGEILKGKVKDPVDHFIRGLIAGGASISLKTDIDVIEEECIALGSPMCKFLFKPAGTFEQTNDVGKQLRPINKTM